MAQENQDQFVLPEAPIPTPASNPQVPYVSLLSYQQEILNDVVKRYDYTQEYKPVKDLPLGEGVNGKVVKVRNIKTGKLCAMKTIEHCPKAMMEVSLHYLAQRGDCKYICKIEDIFYIQRADMNNKFYFYLVMELCEGGELFEAIVGRKSRNFNEKQVAMVMRQVVEAVYHLHFTLGIAHRDLKPENILLISADRRLQPEIRLTDFGFAKQSRNKENEKNLKTPCYTPYYAPPEIFNNSMKYDEACDLWSLGVILYIMLVGRPPFFSTTGRNDLTPGMRRNIDQGKYAQNDERFLSLSKEAQDLIKNMLLVNKEQRITIDRVIKHPYIKQENIRRLSTIAIVYKESRPNSPIREQEKETSAEKETTAERLSRRDDSGNISSSTTPVPVAAQVQSASTSAQIENNKSDQSSTNLENSTQENENEHGLAEARLAQLNEYMRDGLEQERPKDINLNFDMSNAVPMSSEERKRERQRMNEEKNRRRGRFDRLGKRKNNDDIQGTVINNLDNATIEEGMKVSPKNSRSSCEMND